MERDFSLSNSNGNEEGGWKRVIRRQRRSNIEGMHHSKKHHNINSIKKARLSNFDKVMKDKATSFFFKNFPDSWDSGALWKMFDMYGKVVDVYIAFKRTKKNTRFRFVRFINVKDMEGFESRLKGILIGNSRSITNRAKFMKVGGISTRADDFPPLNPRGVSNPKAMARGSATHSFKEAVAGHTFKLRCITIEEDKNIRDTLNCCWTATAKNLRVLQNAWDIIQNNGLIDCKVKYCGGLSFLFEWSSKDVACECMENNKVWLEQWFDNVTSWDERNERVGRLIMPTKLSSIKSTIIIINIFF
ncbi:nucleotide-binding alpha-beta plait domain-containing protein [Tanacetum coccineum]